jgi:hypothetical protein
MEQEPNADPGILLSLWIKIAVFTKVQTELKRKALHPADPLAPDVSGEHRAEAVPPQPDRLVANVDAALEQQVFDVPQAQREADIHQHRETNDLG